MISNIFYFHPYLGKIPILTNIFQMGWNHHLVIHGLFSWLKCLFLGSGDWTQGLRGSNHLRLRGDVFISPLVGCLICRDDVKNPSYIRILIRHEIRILSVTNQYFMECQQVFFRGSPVFVMFPGELILTNPYHLLRKIVAVAGATWPNP